MYPTLFPPDFAALWSAVAASFSALASLLIMRIQRRSLLESVRPELVLTEWGREARGSTDSAHEVITIKAIRNVGRGVALNLHLLGFMQQVDNRPTAVLSTTRIPVLAPNETAYLGGEIIVWWKNVPPSEVPKFLPVTIKTYCWDSRGMRHDTKYSLLVIELSKNMGMADEIAPGVGMALRSTVITPVWVLKLRLKISRIPGLRRILADKS